MNNSGVWILGEEDSAQRAGGAGIHVEYSGARGPARWVAPKPFSWDYKTFADARTLPEPEQRIQLTIEPGRDGNLWAINGKSWPNTDPVTLRGGVRNRFIIENRADMDHPVHLHRHTFELVSAPGIRKDVVIVPARKTVELDVMADNPGPSLFHCHQQFHMDFGFMALARYAQAR
jgi:FtsP/CotA-like multicopper oxidase with cupredoxin domain